MNAQDIQNLILPIGIIGAMYFFMIRPQQQKAKKLKDLRESLTKGSTVITAGGIHGKILSVEETSIVLEIDKGTKIKIEKSSVSGSIEEAV